MNEYFNIGDIIYGFCNGFFGRDDYDTKRCVMITPKYAVFEYLDGELEGMATVLNLSDRLDQEMVDSWKQEVKY